MVERPLSRQMACHWCDHEHTFLPCESCVCLPHDPPGIYPEETP